MLPWPSTPAVGPGTREKCRVPTPALPRAGQASSPAGARFSSPGGRCHLAQRCHEALTGHVGGADGPAGSAGPRERSVSGVSPAPTLTFLPASGPWGPVGTGSPLSCGPQSPVTPTSRTESAFPSPCPAQSLPCARSKEGTRFRGRRLAGRVGPSKASWGSDCTCWGRGSGGYAGRWDVRGGWPGRLPRGHIRKTEPVLRGFLKRRGKLQDDKAAEGGL